MKPFFIVGARVTVYLSDPFSDNAWRCRGESAISAAFAHLAVDAGIGQQVIYGVQRVLRLADDQKIEFVFLQFKKGRFRSQ